MAIIDEIDEEAFNEWLESRPEVIKELAKLLPPGRLYRLKTSNHRCTLHSYNEDRTVTVNVTGEYNRVLFSRSVFGIKPEDLEECDLPGPDEDLGDTSREAGYSDEDITNILIPKLRETLNSPVDKN
jgi:hypothetical protein